MTDRSAFATNSARGLPGGPRFGPASVLLAALLLIPAAPVPAEELGRLFLTPERRAALERQRQLNIRETEAKVVEGDTLGVSGIVQRSSGRSTAWINNTPQDEKDETGVRIRIDRANPGQATVVAGEEQPASLKVGETVNRSTRETSSGIGEGRIVVKSGTGKPR
ncbi:hypothetical protein RHDC3_01859 [Rhodocyclaceae bacterium]|nr:hypothetical protein RHDC3_01859 [Rhodocyclaceae bacterium]